MTTPIHPAALIAAKSRDLIHNHYEQARHCWNPVEHQGHAERWFGWQYRQYYQMREFVKVIVRDCIALEKVTDYHFIAYTMINGNPHGMPYNIALGHMGNRHWYVENTCTDTRVWFKDFYGALEFVREKATETAALAKADLSWLA